MVKFWVVGGRYANTRFDTFAEGAGEERAGPFDTYEDAEKEWQSLSWRTVDNCYYRYRVVEEESVA